MQKEQNSEVNRIRVLFVDDEANIRMTLPLILEQQGFHVTVAASVAEALDFIKQQHFDVLLTDLNIGSAADGFILVSAMRQLQPSAATFILTGYPDFQTALEAIRKQVDDYFTKPADISTLIAVLKEKSRRPRLVDQVPSKRAAAVILESRKEIIERWLKELISDPRLMAIPISNAERIDCLPLLLNELAKLLEPASKETQLSSGALSAAAVHGTDRARQGYTIPLLVAETRMLNRVVATVLQENLLSINLSTLIPEALKIGEALQALLEESIRAFQSALTNPRGQETSRPGPKIRAKAS
jgi:ActR/RegA family two-component response regulator